MRTSTGGTTNTRGGDTKGAKLDVWLNFVGRTAGGMTDVSVLTYNGNIVNTIVCFKRGDEADFFGTVYEDSFGKYSPGKIHLYYLIKGLCTRNARRLNFLSGDEKYKRLWANGEYYTHKVFFHHRSSLSGLLLSVKKALKGA